MAQKLPQAQFSGQAETGWITIPVPTFTGQVIHQLARLSRQQSAVFGCGVMLVEKSDNMICRRVPRWSRAFLCSGNWRAVSDAVRQIFVSRRGSSERTIAVVVDYHVW